MRLRQSVLLLAALAAIPGLVSCGGSPVNATTTTLKAITVSLSGAPASLSIDVPVPLTATVTNDPANAGVTWSVTCGSSVAGACGTFSNTTKKTVTYTAPATVPMGQTVTVMATSVTAPDASPSATIKIMEISVALSGVPTTLVTNGTAALTAKVSNDTTNSGVTWSVSCRSSAAGGCGTISNATATTATFTAPAAIPPGQTVTIKAASKTDPSRFAYANITIAVISVSLSAPTSLVTNTSSPLSATVVNDPNNAGVTWSLACGSSGACGALSNITSTSATYTAPAEVPAGGTVTITATSITDPTKSASATITIMGISVTLTGAPSFLEINGTATITATVNNDPAHAGVTWAVSCGSSGGCGALSNTTITSATYTAPGAVPTGKTVNVTATSISDTTQSATATITIVPPPLADGTYVFSLAGNNSNDYSPYYVAGAFVVSGGVITNGEQDYVDDSNYYLMDPIDSGTQTITGDGNLQITLTTADGSVGSGGVETINGALVSSTSARIIEFDYGLTSSGSVDLQNSTTEPTAGYAFFTAGLDSSYLPVAIGGVINVDGSGTISGKGSVFDINDASYDGGLGVLQDQSFQSKASTVSPPDNFGRVVFSLVPSAASGVATINLAGYIVDATHIKLVETSGDSFVGVMGGIALGQGSSTGKFSTASISGLSFAVGMTGADTNGDLQVAGALTTNTDGSSVSGVLNFNDYTGGGAQTPIAFTGTYTVDSTGRVTLSNLTDNATFDYTAQLYLTATGQGSEQTTVSMDTNDVLAGYGFQQSGSGSFSASSFSGTYALDATGEDPGLNELDAIGPIMADGSASLNANQTVDLNSLTFGQFTALPVTGAFSSSANGAFTGTVNGLDVTNCTIFSGGSGCSDDVFVYYVIDTTRVIAIETDTNQLTLGLFTLEQ